MARFFLSLFLYTLILSCGAPVRSPAIGMGSLAPSSASMKIPPVGGWLAYDDGKYADWLGLKYYGRLLREPINIIIMDNRSPSPEIAIQKIMKECKKIGYEEEYGHSSGYTGMINGAVYNQIPNEKHMAFSNKDFFRTNNHGRIIGPASYNGAFIFIAGFSTERPSIIKGFHHSFVSFNQARDDFATKMGAGSVYKLAGTLKLDNVVDTETTTTADHDGLAVVFEAVE
jgi:hypothetical protein